MGGELEPAVTSKAGPLGPTPWQSNKGERSRKRAGGGDRGGLKVQVYLCSILSILNGGGEEKRVNSKVSCG